MYAKVRDFFNSTEEPNTLMRGIKLGKQVSKIADGIFSTSIRNSNASAFADFPHTAVREKASISDTVNNFKKNKTRLSFSENHQKVLKDELEIGVDSSKRFFNNSPRDFASGHGQEMGVMLRVDTNKLQAEKRVIAILTGDGLDALKKKWPAIKFKGGEGEVVINV